MHTTLHRLAAAAVLIGAGAARGQQYTVTDLGTLGGNIASGLGINDAGHAAGAATNVDANYGGLFFAGSPVGIAPQGDDSQCWALGVGAGDAVIAASFTLGGLVTHGLIWQNGTVTALGDITPRAINGAGVVAGTVLVADPDLGPLERAATWQSGTVSTLGTLGGTTALGSGIDSGGRVVGWSTLAGDASTHAVLWQGGRAIDLGTLGGAGSQAYAINDAGAIAGYADTAGGQPHACVFTVDGAGNVLSRQDLGALSGGYSYAYGVNGAGQVVGTSGGRAFLFSGGAMVDLNTRIPAGTGWVLERAWAINSAGQIVGSGLLNGSARAFLLGGSCYANCDGSSAPPVLNISDFICFLNRYAAGDPYANCDGSSAPPVLNVSDFICYLNRYARGCS